MISISDKPILNSLSTPLAIPHSKAAEELIPDPRGRLLSIMQIY